MKTFAKILAGFGMLTIGVIVHADDVRLQGGGSTFVNPMMQRWVTEYQKQHPEAKIDYQSIGSGGGVKGITDKTFDFGASDAPLNKKEKDKLGGADKIVEFPVIAGAIVLAYNLPDVQSQLKLDGVIVADIYLGKVTKWNDLKIQAMNPDVVLPSLPITTVHRTDGSGTTYVFTSYLTTQSEEFKNKVGGAKQVEWPMGSGGPGNAGVTAVVKATKGAMGYIELAYATENKIPFALLKNKDGNFIKASTEAVTMAGEGALAEMTPGHLAVNIWNRAGKEAYPISGFTYITVYKDLAYVKDEKKAEELVEFFIWATTEGEKLAPPLNYSPLSAGVQKRIDAELKSLTWDGKPVVIK